jgi:hypothetical protein
MKPETAKIVEQELKQFGANLNLSDQQKTQLSTFMEKASAKIDEYRQQNPNATPDDILAKVRENKDALRKQLEGFLDPDQLKVWDDGIAKAKSFLGQDLG